MAPQVEELYSSAVKHLEHWDLDEAEEALREVIKIDPEHARAMNKLGVVFARREDLRQAEDCFNQAIALDPNLASAVSNLGNIYAERGWNDRAQAAYEKALILDPDNPTATHNLGVLYRKSGNIGKGVDLMKRASKAERTRFRSEARSTPENRRKIGIGWAVLIGLAILLLYLFRR